MLSTHKANQQVKIIATECGTTSAKTAATVKTNATGVYTTSVTPTVGTTYQASQKSIKSPTVAVTVAPVLKLVRVSRGCCRCCCMAPRIRHGRLMSKGRRDAFKSAIAGRPPSRCRLGGRWR